MFTFRKGHWRVVINGLIINFMMSGLLFSGTALAETPNETTDSQSGLLNPKLKFTVIQAQSIDGLGRQLTDAETIALDSHIFADGAQLPEGQGSVEIGKNLYLQQCASCHGGRGEGGSALELTGDRSLLATEYPDKGIGVYWPYAPTLFQYIQRAMPPDKPGLLTNDDLYSLISYLLYLNDLMPDTGTLDGHRLADIKLPNRDGFVDQITISTEPVK